MVEGGGLQRGEGGLCTIRFPARCEAVSLLLPAPGYSERDVVLLVYLSTTNRWRNSRVCAAEVPVVLLEGGGDEGGLRGSVGTGGQSAEAPRLNPPCYGEIVR